MTHGKQNIPEISPLIHLTYSSIFALLLLFSATLQSSGIKMFGYIPDISFSLICAIGFVMGERYGAVFGLIGGVLISALGSSGITLSIIMFTLCGYLCGILPDVIFRRNFLSYLIFCAVMGAVHIIFTIIHFIMLSESFMIWSIIGKRIIPEFFSCVLCMIPAYGTVFLIFRLFKGKKSGSGKVI